MNIEMIGLLGIVALLILMAFKMWVGSAMLIVAFVGIWITRSFEMAISVLGNSPFQNINSYTFTVIPMFTLMGMLIAETSIGSDLYSAVYHWLGRFRGGLASASIFACGLLGAITGNSMVSSVIMTKVALPEMRAKGYEDGFATGSIAAGAPLAIIIPPSMGFIMYGILTENSIGKLFMSGIGPGVLQVIMYIAIVYLVCRRHPEYGPPGEKFPLKVMLKASLRIIPMMVLFLIVLGGIYLGIFTTTESGAFGAFGAIIIGVASKQLKWSNFKRSVIETALTSGMVFFMMAGTYMFVTFMSLTKVPFLLSNWLLAMDLPYVALCFLLIVIYFILGCFMPEVPMVALTVPLLYEPLKAVGFDPIWLGCFVVELMALGSISPPVGMTVFYLAGFSKVPVQKIFRGVLPYIIGNLIIIIIMIFVPQLVLFIPNSM